MFQEWYDLLKTAINVCDTVILDKGRHRVYILSTLSRQRMKPLTEFDPSRSPSDYLLHKGDGVLAVADLVVEVIRTIAPFIIKEPEHWDEISNYVDKSTLLEGQLLSLSYVNEEEYQNAILCIRTRFTHLLQYMQDYQDYGPNLVFLRSLIMRLLRDMMRWNMGSKEHLKLMKGVIAHRQRPFDAANICLEDLA